MEEVRFLTDDLEVPVIKFEAFYDDKEKSDCLKVDIPLNCKKSEVHNAGIDVMKKLLIHNDLKKVKPHNINMAKCVMTLLLYMDIKAETCYKCKKKIYSGKPVLMANNKSRHAKCRSSENKADEKAKVTKGDEKKSTSVTKKEGKSNGKAGEKKAASKKPEKSGKEAAKSGKEAAKSGKEPEKSGKEPENDTKKSTGAAA